MVRRAPPELRDDLGRLLDESGIPRGKFGRRLGYRSERAGTEMIRRFLDGTRDIALEKAVKWARICGAQFETVKRDDPWQDAIRAIRAIGGMPPTRRTDLIDLIEKDRRERAAPTRRTG